MDNETQTELTDAQTDIISERTDARMDKELESPAFTALLHVMMDTAQLLGASKCQDCVYDEGFDAAHERLWCAIFDEETAAFRKELAGTPTLSLAASN